jgi:predicted ATPase
MVEMRTALDASASPLSSLGLYTPRFAGPIVGRTRELAAIEQELASAERGLTCLTLEGEPGIGKTRLLLALEEQTRKRGFLPIAVTADEELRGPFLLARSILSCPTVTAAQPADVQQAATKARDALTDGDDPGLANLPPDQKLVRIFDLAALALRLLAQERPVALLVDDLQWADSDSLRMLRYVTRVDTSSPILLALTLRPSEVAFVHEAVTLLADLERIGLVRRLTVGRFNQIQSSEFLHQVLGATIDPTSAATMHSQAEGVPFVLVEQTHAYRASGLLQQVGGAWRLAPNADRLLPAAVRTLIGRRAAHLPEETNAALAEGGILGRRFSLRDLVDLRAHLGDARASSEELARALEPAIAAGLLVEQPPDSPADYSFSHDQIRQHVVAGLEASRRRTIHGAIVDMLAGDTREPSTECLALLAEHAQAAGRNDLCVRFSIGAARAALQSKAPDEALRLVHMTRAVASEPKDRIALLLLQDEGLEMLRRPEQRMEGSAELGALADALADPHLELDVRLRRAAALRLAHDEDAAAEIARHVVELAHERGDESIELAASIELGQDLLRSELGASYTQAPNEADLDGLSVRRGARRAHGERSDARCSLQRARRNRAVSSPHLVHRDGTGRRAHGHHETGCRRGAALGDSSEPPRGAHAGARHELVLPACARDL